VLCVVVAVSKFLVCLFACLLVLCMMFACSCVLFACLCVSLRVTHAGVVGREGLGEEARGVDGGVRLVRLASVARLRLAVGRHLTQAGERQDEGTKSHSHKHFHTKTHSHSHSHSLTLTHTHSLTYTRTPTHSQSGLQRRPRSGAPSAPAPALRGPSTEHTPPSPCADN
jgi:hypothetical protein